MSVTRYFILGVTPADSIIIGSALDVQDCSFERVAIVGSIVGRGSWKDCSVAKTLNLSGVEGIWDNCGLAGNITLDATATEPTRAAVRLPSPHRPLHGLPPLHPRQLSGQYRFQQSRAL